MEGDVILWPDASLERIEAGYEVFTLYVQEEAGGMKMVCCLGYIGFQMIGFWDEAIIDTATVHSDHPLIGDCERRLKLLPATGAKTRATTGNQLLEIIFIDGCKLWVCAQKFRCEESVSPK